MKATCVLPLIDSSMVRVESFFPMDCISLRGNDNRVYYDRIYVNFLRFLWMHVPSLVYDRLCNDLSILLNIESSVIRAAFRELFMQRCTKKEDLL